MLSREQEEIRSRLAYDTPFWAKHCAKILNKRRQLVPLEAYPWQLEFDAALEKQRAAGMPMRAIILKARKLGFSTWVAAKMLQRVTQFENQVALVVAQDVKTAGQIFDMSRRMYQQLPTPEELGMPFSIRPYLTGQSASPNGRKFMAFSTEQSKANRMEGFGGESLLEIDSANSPDSGRGYTPSMIHGSEVAYWRGTGKLVGLLNALPSEPDTLAVLESTANGFNHFHKRWELAVQGAEDPDTGGSYVPLFFGWHRNPFNRQEFLSPEERERFERTIGIGPYGEAEPVLIEHFNVTPEQLLWRRATIREQCDDSVEVFGQEHPATPEEAFIGSGTPVFSGILVARAIRDAAESEGPKRGMLQGADFRIRTTRGGTINVPQATIWVPEEKATDARDNLIRVWEQPKPDGQYVAFADIAMGEGVTFEEGDFHAIQVFDHVTKMQVARYRSRIDIHELPMLVYLIGLHWNTAWLAVEVNGPGLAVVEPLKRDLKYPRLYRRRKVMNQTERLDEKIGWSTDRYSKPLMELAMGTALQEGTHGIRDVMTARELSTYVSDERGKHGAQIGAHDDLLIAAMGAHRVMDVVRPRDPDAKRSRRVSGFHTP